MKSKLASRTFWFAAVWTSFVPFGIAAQVILQTEAIPLSSLLTLSGSIVLAYTGGEKARDALRERK